MAAASAKVEHKEFGSGSVMAYANGIAKIKFKRKGSDGKFIRSVSVEYLTGEVMVLAPDASVSSPYRSLDKTATERAWRDYFIGIVLHDGPLCLRGFHGLLTIGRKACRGLSMPNAHKFLLRGKVRNNEAYDRTVDYLVDSAKHQHELKYMFRHIRNRFIDDIRKANAQKRRLPPTVTYNDAMGTFRESFEAVDRTPNHRCNECRTAFYAKRKDARHCNERCQKRAERKKS